MTIQTTGTTSNGSAIVTSIPDTSKFKVGYYIFGTGIAGGTTILSIDSASQVTMSATASSGGSISVAISPWLLGSGTIKLPDVTTAGRYRRSRTSTTAVGQLQSDQNQAHTHSLSVTGTTDSQGAHTHTATSTDSGHTHQMTSPSGQLVTTGNGTAGQGVNNLTTSGTGFANITTTVASAGAHTHSVTSTGTSGSNGGTEARPTTLIVLTCVKT